MRARSVAVVGAGWAGLAAAVRCVEGSAKVTLFEMAPRPGGRARDIGAVDEGLDNGQHIAIGAYRETLALMATVGVGEGEAFLRRPLALVGADGQGLRLPEGSPIASFVRAVLGRRGWSWRDRLALLRAAAGWRRSGFACGPSTTVADLARSLPTTVRRDLIDPLCVAALNTPAADASGAVFLRVLGDALTGGRGASDLLLPRQGLSSVLPTPALAWLERHGADIRLGTRVGALSRVADARGDGWSVDGLRVDRVVVAASAAEAVRLAAPHSPDWAARTEAIGHEPIVTVYASSAGTRLTEPMLLLDSDDARPAQFVFDRGQLGGPQGLLAFVVSGAARWVARGADAIEQAVRGQAGEALTRQLAAPLVVARVVTEKRATFRCVPLLDRPPGQIVDGLVAAGDYVDGPYPATLEGSVRSGVAAAAAVLA